MYVLHHTFKFSKNHRLENFFVKSMDMYVKQSVSCLVFCV